MLQTRILDRINFSKAINKGALAILGSKMRVFDRIKLFLPTVEFKNDYVLGFIVCEIFTVISLQDWVGWGILP